jgi:hypothetical protein
MSSCLCFSWVVSSGMPGKTAGLVDEVMHEARLVWAAIESAVSSLGSNPLENGEFIVLINA